MHASKDIPIVFMFSGQGSQSYHMGRELMRENPVFQKWMHTADQLVQQWLDVSFLDEMYDEKHAIATPFTQTLFTHPAIFAVQYAMTQVLKSLGIHPDAALGASLGEFTAAAVAEVISFEQAMALICLQAQILETHCPNSGGMLAVLAPVGLYESTPLIRDTTTLAAVNTAQHFVLAGTQAKLRSVERLLAEQGIAYQSLPVTHSFHSPILDPVAPIYMPVLERNPYRPPNMPLVFCSNSGPVQAVTPTALWHSIRSPIRVQATLRTLEARNSHLYLDVGPSGTLATFVKHNLPRASASSSLACLTPFGRDAQQLDRVVAALSASN